MVFSLLYHIPSYLFFKAEARQLAPSLSGALLEISPLFWSYGGPISGAIVWNEDAPLPRSGTVYVVVPRTEEGGGPLSPGEKNKKPLPATGLWYDAVRRVVSETLCWFHTLAKPMNGVAFCLVGIPPHSDTEVSPSRNCPHYNRVAVLFKCALFMLSPPHPLQFISSELL